MIRGDLARRDGLVLFGSLSRRQRLARRRTAVAAMLGLALGGAVAGALGASGESGPLPPGPLSYLPQ